MQEKHPNWKKNNYPRLTSASVARQATRQSSPKTVPARLYAGVAGSNPAQSNFSLKKKYNLHLKVVVQKRQTLLIL